MLGSCSFVCVYSDASRRMLSLVATRGCFLKSQDGSHKVPERSGTLGYIASLDYIGYARNGHGIFSTLLGSKRKCWGRFVPLSAFIRMLPDGCCPSHGHSWLLPQKSTYLYPVHTYVRSLLS
jgi:hypothetical protein